MTFTLNLFGDSPAELRALINALASLPQPPEAKPVSHIPSTPHPAQPQSEAVTQPDKPKAPAPAKPKKAAQKPAAAPAETQPEAKPEQSPAPANPTAAEASASPSQVDSALASSTDSKPDSAVLDKIRDLARSLIVQGKQAEVRQLVQSTGAASISKLPPESYTAVWDGLLKLKDEVDENAAG